jgi:hypothetical protein
MPEEGAAVHLRIPPPSSGEMSASSRTEQP